jgi:peptidoglycan/xylan/chitin deacetylase (PgdA/CDA1 family)
MKIARRVVARALNRIVATRPVSARILEESVVVFIYHDVSDQPSLFNSMFGLNVSPAVFSKQLDLIRSYFHVIDPIQLISGGYRTPTALITFDDGNLSYFRTALPILKEKGIPSVVFLNMGTIRGEVCWSGLVTYLQSFERRFYEPNGYRPAGYDFCQFTESEVYRYLDSVDGDALLERVRVFRGPFGSEEDIKAVSREPLVYLGNHLYNHYNATLLSHRLREEYWKNQRVLDAHPRGVRLFSYPFSRYNDETTRLILGEGAAAVFTVGGLPNVNGRRGLYYRVQLDEGVVTERDMVAHVLKHYVGGQCRGAMHSLDNWKCKVLRLGVLRIL